MSSRIVNLTMLGRFGNQLFQYAWGRAYARRVSAELRTERWVGQRLFAAVNDPPITERFSTTRSDLDFTDEVNVELRGYAQSQRALIYTAVDAREWFRFRPEVEGWLMAGPHSEEVVAHLRRGDYYGYGYPVVSEGSYEQAMEEFDLGERMIKVTEETPAHNPHFTGELAFLPDFYRLMTAKVLLRANSTFSWWAGTLGPEKRVFSPVIEGLEGGKEHDCVFVEGNWPRFANLPFTTDLHL